MEIDLDPGTYVVAVSGGVDSMVLIEMLRHQTGLKLIVAHFDHGIRPDSDQDRQLVQAYAEKHGLPFVYHEARLENMASENEARQARYDFLHKVRQAARADAILTAHHQDDRLETAVHNLLRGTGRKGLSSLGDTPHIKRPLLRLTKQELRSYAKQQGLRWREDTTNQDFRYKRNYIRQKLLPKLSRQQQTQLLEHLENSKRLNQAIDDLLNLNLQAQTDGSKLNRQWFVGLPHNVAKEVMAAWLRRHGAGFDKKLIEKLVVAAKTYAPGKVTSVNRELKLKIQSGLLALEPQDR